VGIVNFKHQSVFLTKIFVVVRHFKMGHLEVSKSMCADFYNEQIHHIYTLKHKIVKDYEKLKSLKVKVLEILVPFKISLLNPIGRGKVSKNYLP